MRRSCSASRNSRSSTSTRSGPRAWRRTCRAISGPGARRPAATCRARSPRLTGSSTPLPSAWTRIPACRFPPSCCDRTCGWPRSSTSRSRPSFSSGRGRSGRVRSTAAAWRCSRPWRRSGTSPALSPTATGCSPTSRKCGRNEAAQPAPGRTFVSQTILILNGPNLNLLGKRQPHIYGHETLADVEAQCRTLAGELGFDLDFRQSNREYEIIDAIHEYRVTAAGIIINPGAFTHTSVAILDALNACEVPVIECHISNVHKREAFRHHSYVSLAATSVLAGFGTHGYQLAIRHIARLTKEKK